MSLLSLIPGVSAAKAAVIGVGVVALGLSTLAAKHYYDESHALAARVASQQLQLATYADDAARYEAALADAAAAAHARDVRSAATKRKIANAPVTTACAGSPAIGAVLDSLRHARPSAGSPPGPGVPAPVH